MSRPLEESQNGTTPEAPESAKDQGASGALIVRPPRGDDEPAGLGGDSLDSGLEAIVARKGNARDYDLLLLAYARETVGQNRAFGAEVLALRESQARTQEQLMQSREDCAALKAAKPGEALTAGDAVRNRYRLYVGYGGIVGMTICVLGLEALHTGNYGVGLALLIGGLGLLIPSVLLGKS